MSVLYFLLILCVIWAVVSIVMITAMLDRKGLKTPFPLMGFFIFRNLARYREITVKENGKTDPLFLSFIIAINLALLLGCIVIIWIFRM